MIIILLSLTSALSRLASRCSSIQFNAIQIQFVALPYIDYLHPDYEAYALSLIEEEMNTNFSPVNMPCTSTAAVSLSFKSPLLQSELSRVAAGQSLAALDFTSFNRFSSTSGPAKGLENDLQSWRKAVRDAKISHESESVRLMNLELLASFGAGSHLKMNEYLKAMEESAADALSKQKMKVDQVNAERKKNQDDATPKLMNATRKWEELVGNNTVLANAVAEKRKKVATTVDAMVEEDQ
jgi:pre-mRNA-splicing factor SPF27